MAEKVIPTIGTKEGLFVAEGSKTRGKFSLRGPFSSGVAVYFESDRHARDSEAVRRTATSPSSVTA